MEILNEFSLSVTKYLYFHQNGELLNKNFEDDNLKELVVSKEVLSNVYLLSNEGGGWNHPGGMATDLNIWDRAMDNQELLDWTTCKYIIFAFIHSSIYQIFIFKETNEREPNKLGRLSLVSGSRNGMD